ncbi:3'-5' exonuclease [Butyrivibrio sp. VCD2006]|uniref:3'-5' exonuclease n=1 Tax=Butyrivibrio sp. VCD2006 TaxID=1280664 RepID=UPI0004194DF5|nr:exonuclease domain-containing protein [Butyrivibrio sp. VCD2006]
MLGNSKSRQRLEYMKDYVVFDLETTGTSCYKDRVVEISAIKVNDKKVTDEFSTLVNPECSIPFYASRVNGITDDMVEDAPLFRTALKDFLNFTGDMVLVGHNIHSFDLKFIYRDAEAYYGKIPGNDYVDTLRMARMCLTELRHHSLSDLATYYNISTEGAHRALNDCRMNQAVYEKMGPILQERLKHMETCPKCGNILMRRTGKFGEFWGCSSYPDCRYTRNI